jgi:hypothetical protein
VIGARIQVGSQSGLDRVRVAVEDEGIDQAVASSVAHFLGAEAMAARVVCAKEHRTNMSAAEPAQAL